MPSTPSTQVLIAALNEEEGIGLTISELNKTLGILRSWLLTAEAPIRTVEVAKNLGAQIILQEGLGKGDALAQAIMQSGFNS